MRTLVVVLALLVACATPRGFSAGDRTAIRQVLSAQEAAWNRGDLDGYMAGYVHSDELIFTSGGHIRRGWQETHDKYRARYGSNRATMGQLQFEILDVQPVGADGAIVLGRWRLTALPAASAADGGPAEHGTPKAADIGGVFTLVLVRRPEGWRVLHDHTSVDAVP